MTSQHDSTHIPESIAQRFAEFHAKSPEVYSTLVALARQWVAKTGRRRLGIATLFERARWELAISTCDPDFKLNNSYRAYYARLIMAQEQDLNGLFALRKSQADEQPYGQAPRLDPGWYTAFMRGQS
jgi:hypothetical protein